MMSLLKYMRPVPTSGSSRQNSSVAEVASEPDSVVLVR